MALDQQQKKQAIILVILFFVLGIVFYKMDPLKLFVKESNLPTEAKDKIEKVRSEGVLMAKEMKENAEKTKIAVLDSTKKVKVSIHDSSENLFELLPKVHTFDIILLLDKRKTPYKQNIFMHKISPGTSAPPVKLPKVKGTNKIDNEKTVQFEGVIDPGSGRPTTKFFKEGGEFIFNTILYRILEINFRKNYVKIVDMSEKTSRGDEHEVPLR